MKFHPVSRSTAVSECGAYELRKAHLEQCDRRPKRLAFYNGWHVPTEKHVGASHSKSEVIAACREHAQRGA